MSPTGNTARAFTFIELLFVVLIISILIGLSIPRFKATQETFALRSATGELQAVFEFLSQRSIVEGKIFYLTIDDEKKEYRAQSSDDAQTSRRFSYPREIGIVSSTPKIAFFPDGTIDPVTLQLKVAQQQPLRITTEGVFGGSKILAQ